MKSIAYVVLTIVVTVAGQLLLKCGMSEVGGIPDSPNYISYFRETLTNAKVLLSLGLAFVASLGWMAAVSRLELSYAYPFMASTFPLVLVFSSLIFNESISTLRWAGVGIIWFGVFVVSRS